MNWISLLAGIGAGAIALQSIRSRRRSIAGVSRDDRRAGRQTVFRGRPVSDDVLRKRVRSNLGHAVKHAHALRVDVKDGTVTLSGYILQDQVSQALTRVQHVDGVRGVVNHLEPVGSEDEFQRLQARAGFEAALLDREWRIV